MTFSAQKKLSLIFLLIVFVFFTIKKIKAGEEHNVSGWAWSDNIGWISFNNTTDGSSVNYGVNINNSTGLFSGYAWSDNIGWISFNEAELTGCPSGTCRAELSFSTNEVSGWAKVLNTVAGWDGWISLRDTNYGVSLNDITNELEGWAWSDDFGWISFNCITDGTCATSDYKVIWSFAVTPAEGLNTDYVKVTLTVGNPPTAAFSCDPDPTTCDTSGCTGYTRCLFRLENQSTDPEGPGDIASSTWTITGPTNETVTCTLTPLCDWPLQPIHPAGNYTATLTVEDQPGNKDISAPQNFTIYQEAIADFMCSLTNEDGSWQNCGTISVSEEEIIYFRDDLLAPDLHSSHSEGAIAIISRVWEKSEDGNPFIPFSSDNESNSSTTLGQGSATIRLTITDNNSVTGPRTVVNDDYVVGVKVPLPEWREVSPF